MLQFETLPASWSALLWTFRSCFTAPTFATFAALTSDLVAAPARRTVCTMLTAAGLSRRWHHSRAHGFFARARWCPDQVGLVLARLVVDRLLPAGAPVLIAVDDTLFRRSGRRVHAAAWHHDGAAKGPTKNRVGWGNCWVIAGIVVTLPWLDRPICLPVAFALWRTSKGAPAGQAGGPESKQAIACRLINAIAAACPGRQVHVMADAWYAGADGAAGAVNHHRTQLRQRGLSAGITLTSRLRVNASLNAIAVPVPGKAGRPKRIGAQLGTPKDLAATLTWTTTTVHRYGRTRAVHLTETICLWYGVYRSRAIRVILLRDTDTTTGYDLALITTDLTSPAATIVERYAARWSVEVAIEDAKQLTGVGEARNRTPHAVTRTVPFGLITQSLVVIWYALHSDHTTDVANRRTEAPWYTTKTTAAYQDMLTKLRRTLIAAKFREGSPEQPNPTEILAIAAAWHDAAA
jgi:hypothetical protein